MCKQNIKEGSLITAIIIHIVMTIPCNGASWNRNTLTAIKRHLKILFDPSHHRSTVKTLVVILKSVHTCQWCGCLPIVLKEWQGVSGAWNVINLGVNPISSLPPYTRPRRLLACGCTVSQLDFTCASRQ
jgi:hypothetical protein